MAFSCSTLEHDSETGKNSIVANSAQVDPSSSCDDVQSLLSQVVAPRARHDDRRPSRERLNQIFDVPAAKTLWTKIVDPNDRNCFVNVSTGETDWNPPNEEEGVVAPFNQLISGFLGALDMKETCNKQPQSILMQSMSNEESSIIDEGIKGGENEVAGHGSNSRAERLQSIVGRLQKRRGGLDWWWLAKKSAADEPVDYSPNAPTNPEKSPRMAWIVPKIGRPYLAPLPVNNRRKANIDKFLGRSIADRPIPYPLTVPRNCVYPTAPAGGAPMACVRNCPSQKPAVRMPAISRRSGLKIPSSSMSSGAGGNLEMEKKLPEVVTLTSSDGENNNEFVKRAAPKKRTTSRLAGQPKRPMSAYLYWLEENLPSLRRKAENHRDAIRLAGLEWNVLNQAEREKWVQMGQQAKQRYNHEMALFKKKNAKIYR